MEAGAESSLEEISKQFADIVYNAIARCISRYNFNIKIEKNNTATGSKIENIAGLINREENYKILDELLMNGEIIANLTESFELDKRFSKDDFISMLYYNGYITIKELDGMELKFIIIISSIKLNNKNEIIAIFLHTKCYNSQFIQNKLIKV